MRTKLDLDKKTWDEIFEWHKKFQEEQKTKQNLEKKTGNEAKKFQQETKTQNTRTKATNANGRRTRKDFGQEQYI